MTFWSYSINIDSNKILDVKVTNQIDWLNTSFWFNIDKYIKLFSFSRNEIEIDSGEILQVWKTENRRLRTSIKLNVYDEAKFKDINNFQHEDLMCFESDLMNFKWSWLILFIECALVSLLLIICFNALNIRGDFIWWLWWWFCLSPHCWFYSVVRFSHRRRRKLSMKWEK